MDIDANPGNFEWPAVPGNDGPENFDAFGNAEAEAQVLGGEEAAPPLPLLQEFQYPEVTVTVKTVQEALLWLLSMYRPVSWVTMTQARNQLTNVCFALNPCTMQYVVGPYLLPLGWQSVRTGKTVVRPAEHFYFEITGKNEHDGKLDIQMKRGCGPRRFESIADIDWMAFDLDDNSDLTGQEIYKIRDLLQSNYFASVWASLIEYSCDQCEDLLKSVLPLYGLSGTKPETLRRLLLNAVDKNCRCGSTHLQVSRQGQEENQRFVYLLGERPVCTARIMANNYPRTCRSPAIKAGVFTKAGKPPLFLCAHHSQKFCEHQNCVCGGFVNFTQPGAQRCLQHGHMYHEQCAEPFGSTCPHTECQTGQSGTAPLLDTELEVVDLIRVEGTNGSVRFMALIGSAKNLVRSEELVRNYINFLPFAQLDEQLEKAMLAHMQINSFIPLAISAAEAACDNCRILVKTAVSVYAHLTVEPWDHGRAHAGSPMHKMHSCVCSSFSSPLHSDHPTEQYFTARAKGTGLCQASFTDPEEACGFVQQPFALFVNVNGDLVPRYFCLTHLDLVDNHQMCPCGKFSAYEFVKVCDRNHVYHLTCYKTCPHIFCSNTGKGNNVVTVTDHGTETLKPFAWSCGRKDSLALILDSHMYDRTKPLGHPFLTASESHLFTCLQCARATRYWVSPTEGVVGKERCGCFTGTQVGTVQKIKAEENEAIAFYIEQQDILKLCLCSAGNCAVAGNRTLQRELGVTAQVASMDIAPPLSGE